jgi:hypothetical protein
LILGKWFATVSVPAGEFNYAMTYKAQRDEKKHPVILEQVKLITPSCATTLQRAGSG